MTRAGRVAALTVLLLVLAGVGAVAWMSISVTQPSLDLPPPDTVAARFLDDGRPVFVVRDDDGSVAVVDGVSPHVPDGQRPQALVYCSSSQTLNDPRHGSRFLRNGAYISGPAPHDLATYRVDVRGDELLVGTAHEPTQRSHPDGYPGGLSGPVCDAGQDPDGRTFIEDELSAGVVAHLPGPGADDTISYPDLVTLRGQPVNDISQATGSPLEPLDGGTVHLVLETLDDRLDHVVVSIADHVVVDIDQPPAAVFFVREFPVRSFGDEPLDVAVEIDGEVVRRAEWTQASHEHLMVQLWDGGVVVESFDEPPPFG